MKAERWEKAKNIFEQALTIAPDARGRFLDEACSDDKIVRREVEELLSSLENADSFMENPAVNQVAKEIVGENEKLETGRKLLHYEIIRQLGTGGMGEVYLAKDTKLIRRVAVKILPAASNSSAVANERLLREARAAAKLDHPNICTIHEIAESDGRNFIVMQFIEGQDLGQKIRHKSLDFRQNLRIAIQIAEALGEAHANKIIHRDIKPANIIITQKYQAKVLDFGLAKSVAHESEEETAKLLSVTGAIMGTVPYMSPEQVKGKKLDARTDIFSFGALVYEMFCGKQLFRRDNNAETISAILNFEPPLKGFPENLREIMQKCLAKDKAKRYQNTEDLVSDLKTLLETSASDVSFSPENADSSELHTLANTAVQSSKKIAVETGAASAFFISKYKNAAIFALAAIFIGITLGYYFWQSRPNINQPTESATIDSLAVLPFENTNPDTEYLSDGIAESLINSLSNLPNLRVISRTTVSNFKGGKQTPQEIGRILNVRTVLTGKVSQNGEQLSIQVELVDLSNNSQLWGERFDGKMSEILQVQGKMAQQITEKLQLKLNNQQKAQIAKYYTENAEAYREYLKGRFYTLQFSLEGHKKALEHLNNAIEIDPTYALAYAGIADAYTTASDTRLPPREALTKAKAAANKALELDDQLAEAYAARGHARLHEWDKSAIDDLNKASALAPNSLTTQLWLGEYYMIWDVQKSVQILEKATELDPLSAIPLAFLSFDYFMLHQPEKAIENGKKSFELNPNLFTESAYIARVYASIGDLKSAENEINKIPPEAADAMTLSTRGMLFAQQGKRQEAEKIVAEMQKLSETEYISPFELALVYLKLNNRDKMFFYLDKAFEDRSENLGFIRNISDFDPIRDDARYADLMKRIGFTD